jgi:hypothetical protein
VKDRRARFFFGAAALCAAMTPLVDAELRWVPMWLAVLYVVLALASMLDRWSAEHAEHPEPAERSGAEPGARVTRTAR